MYDLNAGGLLLITVAVTILIMFIHTNASRNKRIRREEELEVIWWTEIDNTVKKMLEEQEDYGAYLSYLDEIPTQYKKYAVEQRAFIGRGFFKSIYYYIENRAGNLDEYLDDIKSYLNKNYDRVLNLSWMVKDECSTDCGEITNKLFGIIYSGDKKRETMISELNEILNLCRALDTRL